jgi:hypothetical protein
MKLAAFLLLLAALPATLAAQTTPTTQPRPGDLVGRRPSPMRRTAAAQAAPATAENDPAQQRLLQTTIDLGRARAEQLPELYERLIGSTRAEHRQWNASDWAAAGQVLARLDQRYAQVRPDLPLEERLRVRAFQGEFRTLRGTRNL